MSLLVHCLQNTSSCDQSDLEKSLSSNTTVETMTFVVISFIDDCMFLSY